MNGSKNNGSNSFYWKETKWFYGANMEKKPTSEIKTECKFNPIIRVYLGNAGFGYDMCCSCAHDSLLTSFSCDVLHIKW